MTNIITECGFSYEVAVEIDGKLNELSSLMGVDTASGLREAQELKKIETAAIDIANRIQELTSHNRGVATKLARTILQHREAHEAQLKVE